MDIKKIQPIAITAFVCLIMVGIAVNVPTWTVANTATVVSAEANITAWKDGACTQPLNSIEWGEVKQGQTTNTTFWLKNEGSDPIYPSWEDDASYSHFDTDMYYWDSTYEHWWWWYGEDFQLEPDETVKIKYEIHVRSDCPVRSHNWTLTFGY